MRVFVAGEEYTATADNTSLATSGIVVFTFPEMEIEKSGKFKVLVDLDSDATPATVVTFDGSFDELVFS
jgi:hypothetical protein